MTSIDNISSLFNQKSAEEYISPLSLGFVSDYEIIAGNMTSNSRSKIAGFKLSEFKSVDDLYSIIHQKDRDEVIRYTLSSVTFMNEAGVKLLDHQAKIIFRVIGRGGKLHYIRRNSVANGQSDSKLVSNYSMIEDVTWMRPKPLSNFIQGPKTEAFDFEIPEIVRFSNNLSPRELEILRLVARGFQSSDISRMLKISTHTVSTHRKNMLKKLEVANTPELMTLARDMGLI